MVRLGLSMLAFAVWLQVLATGAFAQMARPPSGPQIISIDKAWQWLVARPGVIIAIVVAIAAIIYMLAANRRRKA